MDVYYRSLSELDSLRLSGEAGDKIRQVTERATLFRITSNAMINVSFSSSLIPLNIQIWRCWCLLFVFFV